MGILNLCMVFAVVAATFWSLCLVWLCNSRLSCIFVLVLECGVVICGYGTQFALVLGYVV